MLTYFYEERIKSKCIEKKKRVGIVKKRMGNMEKFKICIKRVDLRVFRYASGYNVCFG
jgi:hypothetical protein